MTTPRLSVVKSINIKAVGLSSVFLVGDAKTLTPSSKVFALQRELPIYDGREPAHELFPRFFNDPLPQVQVTERVNISIVNESPVINVGDVNVIGISTAGIFQIGTNERIICESRVKNIRHFTVTRPEIKRVGQRRE